jgi:transposase
MKFVSNLSDNELGVLSNLIKDAAQHRTRQRAHAIVLSSKNYSIDDISEIFDVHRDTVSRWIDVWGVEGMNGLFDAPKPGRPRKNGIKVNV